MQTSKVFIKKTRRGRILKVVREHYLRDDVGCGSLLCSGCETDKSSVLEICPFSPSILCDYPHYILIDTNVVLHQIDVLEAPVIRNVIVVQTVLEEVRKRSSPIYKKLRDILGNKERAFYAFINEHHKETYVDRLKGETANDRNDRAIRKACLWYQSHLQRSLQNQKEGKKLKVILLSDDVENRARAVQEGIPAFSVEDYIRSIPDHPELHDKLSHKMFAEYGSHVDNAALFPEHLSPAKLLAGIKAEKYFQGVFYANRDNFLEGTVNVEGRNKPILLQGHVNLNRAVDGDIVAIEILPEDQWTAPAGIVLEDDEYDPGDTLCREDILLKSSKKAVADRQPTGRVVAIVRRKWRQYCGVLQLNPVAGSTRHIFVPADKRVPRIRIETQQGSILAGQRLLVAIDSWPRTSRYPVGHFVRALGPVGEKNTENEVLLLEHDVPHYSFPQAVLNCLPSLPWMIMPEDFEKRADFRHLDICSVDPPGCTDIDDALHCRTLENGNVEVGVHIADVSHFIRPNTAIDQEASLRGTTVYLVDRRIDMVPELLSSNLCSLRGGEERFAFSVLWEMTPDAKIVNKKFTKSIIRSKSAFTYAEAQAKIDDPKQNDSLAISLRRLNNLAKIMKTKRLDQGALVLASPEIRFEVDTETHDPVDVHTKSLLDTNSMVEEFMLLANITVAEAIYQHFPEYAVLRKHPPPPPTNFDPLLKAGKTQGFEIQVHSGKSLADSLDKAVRSDDPYLNTMLRIVATRCMLQAVYFCSGMAVPTDFVHYGLAAPIYTHFTSPIRRYADLLVHRLLAVAIGADATYPSLLDKKKVQQTCNNLNYRHRMAQYAQRSSVLLHTHLFFRQRVQTEEAYILYVKQNAVQVLIPKYGLEGVVYIKNQPEGSTFTFNPDEPSQRCGDIVLRPFSRVRVEVSLDRTNIQHERLVVRMLDPVQVG